MRNHGWIGVGLMVGSLVAGAALAQQPLARGARDPGEHLSALLGKQSFSATAHMSMTSPHGDAGPSFQVAYKMLDGKVRTETDLAQLKADMPAEAVAQIKAMGMDRTVHIFLPEKKLAYMIYPGIKSYCEVPTQAPGEEGAATEEPKIERTEVGKETVDGHPCVKYKVQVTSKAESVESLMWLASDLKDFPIQTQMQGPEGTIRILFKDIQTDKPEAALFEPPTDYQRYASMRDLMMSQMKNMMPPDAPHGAKPPAGGDEDEDDDEDE